jgi:antitoxin ParD1/3/4
MRLPTVANSTKMKHMPTQNVNLSEQQAKFIRQSIKAGRFRNTSEVVRAGLWLLEQRTAEDKLKLEALRKLTTESFAEIDRGNFETVDPDGIDAFMEKLDARVRAKKVG